MFNWINTPKDKGRIKQLILEFVAVPGPDDPAGSPGNPNGDVLYEIGHEDGENFIPIETRTLHFDLAGVKAIISAIQGTSTLGEARNAVEALLVAQLERAST
jgi:hypothetical protein